MPVFPKRLSLLAMAMLGLLLASCAGGKAGSGRLTAQSPKDEAFRNELKKELSTVNVAIEMSANELSDNLNRVLPRELYNGSTSFGGLSAAVTRNGAVAATIADNYLHLTVPVFLSLRSGLFQSPAIPTKLKFKISARVTPDWRLEPEVHYTGLSDSLAEEVNLGPLSFRPRSIIEGMTVPLQRSLSEAVKKKLNDKLALKAQVAKAWNEAQKPILLDRNYRAWLVLSPREVVLYPLYAQKNEVRITVGLTSFAEVVVGPQPALRPPLPLPPLKQGSGADRSFRLAVNTDLFYKDLVGIASPLLLNKELGSDGRSVVIKDLDLYGNGERLIVKVETTGSVEGVFYLTCRPVFNPASNVLSVEELDFELESRNMLLRTADWFLHSSIRSRLQERLKVDLTPRLAEARQAAGKSLTKMKLAENVFLSGKVKEMRLGDLMVQRDRVSLRFYLEGESSVAFH